MARPSNHIDQRLLDSGLALLPTAGCRGLSARRLAAHAGVNPGMFHYHFRSKDNFVRTLLERLYQQLFAALELNETGNPSPRQNLREALTVLGRFGIANRDLLARVAADAIAGEPVAIEFLRSHTPKHIEVLTRLIHQAQQAGEIEAGPITPILSFLCGAVMLPSVLNFPADPGDLNVNEVTDAELNQRIEFALRGLMPSAAMRPAHL